jgi:integrase
VPKKPPKLPPLTSAKAVQEAKHSGRPNDDRRQIKDTTGLYLNIKPTNSKSWLYRYSFGGKRLSPMGLGAYPEVSLKAARQVARDKAELVAKNIDPKEDKKRVAAEAREAEAKSITFKQYTEETFLPLKENDYKDPASVRRIRSLLRDYIYPTIGHMAITDIDRQHVVDILKKKSGSTIFLYDKPIAAERTHIYIAQIMRHAKADRLIEKQPIVWKHDMEMAFTTFKKIKKKSLPRPALYWKKLPAFVKNLLALDKPKGARPDVQCMMFGILTQARSNEARGVTWEEIDLKNKVWNVPDGKYKSKNRWAIPLCDEAIKILKAQPSFRHKEGRIFSRLDGGPIYSSKLSDMGLTLGYKEEKHPHGVSERRWVVFNGFRRTFRTWSQDREFNNEASELQMKHLDTAKLKQVYIDDPDGWAMFARRKTIINSYERWAMKGRQADAE